MYKKHVVLNKNAKRFVIRSRMNRVTCFSTILHKRHLWKVYDRLLHLLKYSVALKLKLLFLFYFFFFILFFY